MDKPEDLHAREYAMQIMESIGMPLDRGQSPNFLIITESIIAISKVDFKGKKLTISQSHEYLKRAIRIAKERGENVDYFFFKNGVYMNMRPVHKPPEYKPLSKEYWEETKRQQSGPEWDQMVAKMDALLKSMTMPGEKK